ncbi:MAG: serine protease, partial [Candidatus Baltobacteraceae bacterium]
RSDRVRAAGAVALAALATLAACSSGARSNDEDPFVQSFAKIRPSVVLFTMNVPSDDPKKKGQWDEAYGSGFVVASGAWGSRILTAEHVIHDARDLRLTVGEKRIVPARVVASDERDDLALVETREPDLPAVTLGTSRDLLPGTAIGVAGFPIPDAFHDEGLVTRTSVYAGRLSSIRNDSLELDLPVIPGESGGPIFDARSAAVVGLAESRFDEEKAIGFGIPVEDAERFIAAHVPPASAGARDLTGRRVPESP